MGLLMMHTPATLTQHPCGTMAPFLTAITIIVWSRLMAGVCLGNFIIVYSSCGFGGRIQFNDAPEATDGRVF